jgi:integrase
VRLIVQRFGKSRAVADLHQDDFAALRTYAAKLWGPHRVGKAVQVVRSVFKFAFDTEMVQTPIRFGPGFARPTKKTMRLHKAKKGAKLFTADEARGLIDAAGVQVKAMVLLGVNCGFGNADCSNLPLSALDLDVGMIDFPRPKTGIARRCPPWPETVAGIREALASRPEPKAEAAAGLVFVTKYGDSWATHQATITHQFRKLLDRLGNNGHRNFCTLRHTFRTVADAAKDQPAADYLMGHESSYPSRFLRDPKTGAIRTITHKRVAPPSGRPHTGDDIIVLLADDLAEIDRMASLPQPPVDCIKARGNFDRRLGKRRAQRRRNPADMYSDALGGWPTDRQAYHRHGVSADFLTYWSKRPSFDPSRKGKMAIETKKLSNRLRGRVAVQRGQATGTLTSAASWLAKKGTPRGWGRVQTPND